MGGGGDQAQRGRRSKGCCPSLRLRVPVENDDDNEDEMEAAWKSAVEDFTEQAEEPVQEVAPPARLVPPPPKEEEEGEPLRKRHRDDGGEEEEGGGAAASTGEAPTTGRRRGTYDDTIPNAAVTCWSQLPFFLFFFPTVAP